MEIHKLSSDQFLLGNEGHLHLFQVGESNRADEEVMCEFGVKVRNVELQIGWILKEILEMAVAGHRNRALDMVS